MSHHPVFVLFSDATLFHFIDDHHDFVQNLNCETPGWIEMDFLHTADTSSSTSPLENHAEFAEWYLNNITTLKYSD